MADLNVVSSGVLAANANTLKGYGTSGAVIVAGQVVYADPNSTPTGLIKPAKADSTNATAAANVVGIALNSTPGSLQPVTYATGDIILPTTTPGGTLFPGSVYVVSAANAGSIAPNTDSATTNYVSVVGIAMGTAILRVSLNPVAPLR